VLIDITLHPLQREVVWLPKHSFSLIIRQSPTFCRAYTSSS